MASKLEKSRMNFNGKNCFLIILGHGLALFIAISHGFTFGFDSGRLHQAPAPVGGAYFSIRSNRLISRLTHFLFMVKYLSG